MDVEWTRPIQHERKVFETFVLEIFYLRIFTFLFILFASLPFIIEKKLVYLPILLFLAIIVFYPIFIRPWEIILSNKRLILRHQYWNIGRFSTLISFNLDQLDSQKVTPRIKLLPITIGFGIIFSFSFVLIEFMLTDNLPTPIFLEIFLLLFGSIGMIKNIDLLREKVLDLFFSQFLDIAFETALISVAIGLALVIFGLPRRTQMVLSTLGGHQLTVNAGVHDKLTELLYAIGRKHQIESEDRDWKWDIPLLENERIITSARVGLIERSAQFLGIFSLFLFVDSIGEFISFTQNRNLASFVIVTIKVIELAFIWFTIAFAKKFERIIATNRRLIFQMERKQVSGIFGKRVYKYHDLPFKYVQGFRYSNFSGIRLSSVLAIIVIFLSFSALTKVNQSTSFSILMTLFLIFYIIINYQTFTSLSFFSIGGDKIELFYQLPVVLANFSHRLEDRDWLYEKIFPNLLSESEVTALCNTVRSVSEPLENALDKHEVSLNAFIDKDEQILSEWKKLGPFRGNRESVTLGFAIGILYIILIRSEVNLALRPVFMMVSMLILVVIALRAYVIEYFSLIVLGGRLFFLREILPRKVAQIFGILPERSIQEVNLDYVLVSKFQFRFGNEIKKLLSYILLLAVANYAIFSNNSILNQSSEVQRDILVLIAAFTITGLIIPTVRSLVLNIPRYSLRIYTRFGMIQMPYMKDLDRYNEAIKVAKST